MSFAELKKDDWIVGGVALVLLIDLLLLPWWSFSGISGTATGAPDGWVGVLSLLATAAVLADLLIERMSPGTTLPNLGGSRLTTRFYLSVIAVGLLVLKVLLHISFTFDYIGFGFILAVVLSVALLYATRRLNQGHSVLNS